MNDSARSSRAQTLTLIAAFLGWMFDGLEQGIFPLVARPALQEMLHMTGGAPINDAEIGKWMGYITALFLVGAAAGGLVFGWLGDRIGRVRAMSASILTYSIFSGLCAFVATPWQLGALRFVSSLGMGGEWALGVALVMECWPEKHRPMLAGTIGAAANVGYVLIAVLGAYFKVTPTSWRWVMVAGAAPALLTFLIQIFVPESEKWKDAVKTRVSSPLKEIFAPPLTSRTLFGIAFASIALIGTWGSVQWLPLWADKLAGGGNAKAYTQICSGIGAVIGCFIGPWIGGRLGRRPAYFGLCFASLLSCGFLFRHFAEFGSAFLAMVLLVGGVTAAFYGWFPLYLPELFPTRVRATGQGVSYNTGRILAAGGALGQGQLMAYYGGSYAKAGSVITLIYLLGMILIWFAPETRNKPLPD